MIRKIVDSFGYVGLLALALGLFYYSINNVWDWKVQLAVYTGAVLLIVYLVINLSHIRSTLRSRTGRYGGTALLTLLLVVGILALLSFLNVRHHKRIDVTEGQFNALSPQTEKVLENLDRDIQVIGFFSDDQAASQFQSLLTEYRYLSSRLDYEIVDPQEDPGKASQYQVTRDGQVVVVAGAKQEIVEDYSEEKLTNTFIKVTRDEEKVVYFLQGHGERLLDDTGREGYSEAKNAIEKQNYRVETFNLAQENQLPEAASALISAGPQVNFFPNEVQLLQDYLAAGGKLFLMVDPDSDFSMPEFLSEFGVELVDNVVIDASGVGQLFGLGAAAPLVADYADHPITEDLAGAMSFFPRARSLQSSESTANYQTTELLKTSARSWGETNLEAERVTFDEGQDQQGPLTLGIVASKEVETGSDEAAENQVEEGTESEGDASAEVEDMEAIADLESEEADAGIVEEGAAGESRVAVFGDSDFAANAAFGMSVNGDLFLNVVSWLAEDTDLISVRPKDPETRTVTLTASESRIMFWLTVLFFPLATLAVGLAVWYRRR